MINVVGKKVLILGGGTSTLDVYWEGLEYDELWTCNDFYLEQRLLDVKVDLYMLGFMTDTTSTVLSDKLNKDHPFTFYEPQYYRGKDNTDEFKNFTSRLSIPVYSTSIPIPAHEKEYMAMQKSGACFRLVLLAYQMKASKVYFAGFDGFNKEFSNIHAFTKHRGLKPTDTRRTYEGTFDSYVNVFSSAFNFLARLDNNTQTFQNLGEGFDYNIGTPISSKYFPLADEVKAAIKLN